MKKGILIAGILIFTFMLFVKAESVISSTDTTDTKIRSVLNKLIEEKYDDDETLKIYKLLYQKIEEKITSEENKRAVILKEVKKVIEEKLKKSNNKNKLDIYSFEYSGKKMRCINCRPDVNSFKVLNNSYAKDKNYIFHTDRFEGIELFKIQVDYNSFEVLSGAYGKDKNNIFLCPDLFGCVNIPKIDSQSFEILNKFYVKDKNKVYYYNSVKNKFLDISGAISDSFFANDECGKDEKKSYYKEKVGLCKK